MMRQQPQRFLLGILIAVAIHTSFLFNHHPDVSTIMYDNKALFEGNGTTFFIHVGPVKTASSSIQCNLQSNPHLHSSSYYYLGKYERQCSSSNPRNTATVNKAREQAGGKEYINPFKLVFQFFLRGWLRPSLLEGNPPFQKFVDDWKEGMEMRHRRKIHTIYSAEEFCGLSQLPLGKSHVTLTDNHDDASGNGTQSDGDDRVRLMVDFLQSTPQHIRFQVMYRDYFDWVVSNFAYTEYHRMLGKKDESFEGGSTVPSIVDWKYLKDVLSARVLSVDDGDESDGGVATAGDENNSVWCNPFNIWTFLKKLLPYFDEGKASIQILDLFHNRNVLDARGDTIVVGDVGTRYVCNLPNATTACERTRRMTFQKSNPTPMDYIHADRIAMAAWKAGLFANHEFVERKAVNDAILRRVSMDLNATILDLPLECLSEIQVDQLFQTSVAMATAMFGNEIFDVDAMRNRFRKALKKKKFCSVDTKAIIEDTSWKEFFQRNATVMTGHH